MMRQPDGTRRWYLRAIDALAQAGADVRTVSIKGEEWQEVDFPEDVEAAKALTALGSTRGPLDRAASLRFEPRPTSRLAICSGSSVTASPSAGIFGQPASATRHAAGAALALVARDDVEMDVRVDHHQHQIVDLLVADGVGERRFDVR